VTRLPWKAIFRPSGDHDVDLGAAAGTELAEGQLAAVGRPGRLELRARRAREVRRRGAVGLHRVDLEVTALEGDPPVRARERRERRGGGQPQGGEQRPGEHNRATHRALVDRHGEGSR
jgi:hypothetical protein